MLDAGQISMKKAVVFLFLTSSSAYADTCSTKAAAAFDLFNKGNIAYEGQDYDTARQYLWQSGKAYAAASVDYCTGDRATTMASNAGVMGADIHIVECVSKKYSTDVDDLKGCFDVLGSFAKIRIEELVRKQKGQSVTFTAAPPDPQFSSQNEPRSIYEATVQCRSDQEGRGVPLSCVQTPVDLHNGYWRFKLSSGCNAYGYRATVATHDDGGHCIRRVIAFEKNKSSDVGNSDLSGKPPYTLDMIVINRGEDKGDDRQNNMAICYEDRQNGGTCD